MPEKDPKLPTEDDDRLVIPLDPRSPYERCWRSIRRSCPSKMTRRPKMRGARTSRKLYDAGVPCGGCNATLPRVETSNGCF